jgi:predicted enzyme related to lactoylglutathione lyase
MTRAAACARRPSILGEGKAMLRASIGEFCWADLAAGDAARASAFYADVFGWTAQAQTANGGVFTRLQSNGRDVGSLYQLNRAHLDGGVPSHWTPYVRVGDVDAAVLRVASCGGAVIVKPFAVSGVARIALIADAVGAHVGLWQSSDA